LSIIFGYNLSLLFRDSIVLVMKIKQVLFLGIGLGWLSMGTMQAQWSSVSTGGNDTVGGYILSSSVGELLVDDASIPGYRLKFGVQQPLTFPWPGARMKGRVAYASNPTVPLGQVQVLLKQSGTVVGTTTTTSSGDFDLGTRGSGSYALEFVSTALWRGVNTTDALVVMRHFAGAMTLTGIRLQAGNVNNLGLVNFQEALRITQRTVDRNLPFLSGDWAFAPTQVQVQFGDSMVNVPVPALCYGDVNASYFPAPPARLAGDPLLAVGRLDEPNSDTWEWPVYLTESKSIGAMTIELLLPEGLSVEDVLVTAKPEPGSKADPGYLAYKQEGQVLRVSWFGLDALLPRDGEELFRLRVRGNANGPLRLIPTSELADGMAQPYNSFRLAAPVPGSGAWQVALYPNPSSDKASIALTLPTSGTVAYTVLDALGRLVVEGREFVSASGFKGIDLESASWSAGTYSIRIQWQGARTTEDRLLRFVKLNP
jgi:hypothetical protein